MSEPDKLLTTTQKALTINRDVRKYGTFAEIGAGQEVAREFFHAGGASATIAKSISAYDMTFSDAIYGKSSRYVSRERLELMLDHEYSLLVERLDEKRGDHTNFFVFADTVATRNYLGTNEAHGWLGFRFQLSPREVPSEIVLHVRMWDNQAVLQQQALGIVGVNLIYAGLYYYNDIDKLVDSLRDDAGTDRIEVDMLHLSGPRFAAVDNRLVSLRLIRSGLTNAVMFGQHRDVLQPSEVLHKSAVLVERGSFRPVTRVNVDIITAAKAMFMEEPQVKDKEVVVLMEITVKNLLGEGPFDPRDFLARVDLLAAIGFTVLISNYYEYYRLVSYFRRYTKEMVGVAMGVNNLHELFKEEYYENLDGGILEAFGRLFRNSVKLFVYPMSKSSYESYLAGSHGLQTGDSAPDSGIVDAQSVELVGRIAGLYSFVLENHLLESIKGFDPACLTVLSRDVLAKIRAGDSTWMSMVPARVAELIQERNLFR